ncbi:MAG TPA: MarR family transcriptional regulator [Nitrosopumilaceae archaeon]|nr:MarR family transcriptional regulator [Nitrosopumilaceae archaeon]
MGGAKKKSPAQAEKSQAAEAAKKEGGSKKGEKKEQKSKTTISVIIDENQTMNFIKNSKVFTVQEVSRQAGVKVSAANAFLLKLLKNGAVKRISGYSGHHIYQPA